MKSLREAPSANPVSDALRAVRAHVVSAFVFGGGVNILFLASPLFMMQVYGRVLESGSIETLVFLGLALLLALAAMAALDAARGRLLARAGSRIERLLDQPATRSALFNGNGSTRRTLEDLDSIRRFLAGGSAVTLIDLPWTLAFFAILYLLHPVLGLVATVGGTLILLAVGLARLFEKRSEAAVASGAHEIESFTSAIRTEQGELRALGLESGMAERLAFARHGIGRLRLGLAELSARVGATARFFRMLAHSGALAAGAVLTLQGELTPAAMLAAAILAGRALGPIETLPAAWRQAAATRGALERLRALPYLPRTVAGAADGRSGSDDALAMEGAAVRLRRLMVMKPGGGRAALRGLSLKIAPGETVAVAGPSGAGKSVLARCLTGAEHPHSGEIRLDNLDVRDWHPERLARHVGWLPQEPKLFPGTVRDNIARFGDVGDAEIEDAIARAGATDLIGRFERGLATDVGPGGKALPPSARQMVALARALLSRPRLVILDQPTAHQDAEGEVAVISALRRLKAEGVTVVLITHKPVLAALADKIMILEDGTLQIFGSRSDVLNAIRRQSLRPVESAPAPVPAPAMRGAS